MTERLTALILLFITCGSCILIPLLFLILLLLSRRLGVARRRAQKTKGTRMQDQAQHYDDDAEREGKGIGEAPNVERKQAQEDALVGQKHEERLRIVSQLRPRLDELGTDGKVPLHVAQRFIKRCTWWLSHSSGWPVRAPGHYKRIEGSEYDWRIRFGNNYFLVGKAIWRCRNKLTHYLERANNGYVAPRSELVEELMLTVQGAVANGKGYEYRGTYPLGKGCRRDEMVFGTTAIDVSEFVDLVLEIVAIEPLWDDSSE